MSPTRRRFLAWMATAAVVAGAGLGWSRRNALRRAVLYTPLGDEPPGPLRDSTAETLQATVLGLLDDRVEPLHYVDFFRWRAGRLPGYRALYERFEARVDRDARRAGFAGFRSASPGARRAILEALRPASDRRRALRVLFARDEERFARHIVREVFRCYARTAAWTQAGYAAWPGTPRAIARMGRLEPRA